MYVFSYILIVFYRPILDQYGNVLDIRVLGVEYMNDDPSDVDVLYGKVCML